MEIFIRPITLMFIGAVKLYQAVISPLMPQTCRHLPTCSEYTIEALRVFGPFKGTYLGIKRIISCRPGGSHGYDPLPEKDSSK
ncbi:membrane protein insertion efficiency factor YidD [Gammaproteobacteria bacterium]|nr:membrane protein insertion efficiency factor YidD [Gammaproteobacteria bacterium]